MSDIIDDGLTTYVPRSHLDYNQPPETADNDEEETIHQMRQIVKGLKRFLTTFNSDYYFQSSTGTPKQVIRLRVVFYDLALRSISLVLDLVVNTRIKIIEMQTSLVENQIPYKIETLDQRTLFCKLFSKSYLQEHSKIVVDIHSGVFSIVRPSILSFQEDFVDIFPSNGKSEGLHFAVKSAVKDSISIFKLLLRQISPDFSPQTKIRTKNQNDLLKAINRYVVRSPIEPAFDISFGSGKFDKLQFQSDAEMRQVNNVLKKVVTDFDEFASHSLYTLPDKPLKSLKGLYTKEYFTSSEQQIIQLKQKIIPPQVPVKVNSSNESKYIYNIIEINDRSPIDMRKINHGGFSQIICAQVQFWYMLSVDNERKERIEQFKKVEHKQQNAVIPNRHMRKLTKKHLTFKTNNYKGVESGRNRIEHQLKIVSKFKGVSSVFLPQYFKINNEMSPFSQYLIMEYLAYPTLGEYFELNKISMSFLTKIHLVSLIMQSLRFLKTYEIVHMDLKPSNIIISKRMMTKLIDFGQSYNQQTCEKNFKPAFSMPYGSPEIFDGIGKTEFTQKNDVFSWGVIFYQLLFKRHPYFFSREQANRIFKDRVYINHVYFVPQEETKFGSWDIMPVLRNIIFRALDKESANRPCTIWLTVLLKECLSYMISSEIANAV